MPYRVTLRRTFCAAHRLRLGDGSFEPLHGHNWHVTLIAERLDGGLDDIGCVIDFHALQAHLDEVLRPWNNADLNGCAPFADGVNPSAELVAGAVGQGMSLPPGVRVVSVEVTEAEGCSATWFDEPA